MHLKNPLLGEDLRDAGSVLGFDSIELYVSNACQTASYLETNFGFSSERRSDLDTESTDAKQFLLAEGDVKLVLTSGSDQGDIKRFVHLHGDSVKNIALRVDDVEASFRQAVQNGAAPVLPPTTLSKGECPSRTAVVGTPGDIMHTLVQRAERATWSLSNGMPFDAGSCQSPPNMLAIDHVAIAVPRGQMKTWMEYYVSAFGFDLTSQELTGTEFSAMRFVVVENRNHLVKFVITEPADGIARSQIEEFLECHNGSGVQHIAILCADIVQQVKALRANGVELVNIPDGYYDALPSRFDNLEFDIEKLRELGILVDRDCWGELMQTFSKPIMGRPTLFFELVQRNGARGFGANNIRALFEAMERSQSGGPGSLLK